MVDATEFTYTIDADDLLVTASPGYFEFAADGRWPGARASIGEPLWDFVAGSAMRRVQQALVRRLRERGTAVELPFRCDSPSARREMTIEIRPEEGARVTFTARLVAEHPRPPQPLLDEAAARGPQLLPMCGWCDRFEVDGTWMEVEDAAGRLGLTGASVLPTISHGICPDCERTLSTA